MFASDERRPASSGYNDDGTPRAESHFDCIFRLAGVDASGKVVNCRRRTYDAQSEETLVQTLALGRADASFALDMWESGSPAAEDIDEEVDESMVLCERLVGVDEEEVLKLMDGKLPAAL